MPNSLPDFSSKGFITPVYFSRPSSQEQFGSYTEKASCFLDPSVQLSSIEVGASDRMGLRLCLEEALFTPTSTANYETNPKGV